MYNSIYMWLCRRFHRSGIPLLRKIARGMERDREVPLRYVLRKAVVFIYSMITARLNLLKCDRVGRRPRTRHRPYIENMGSIFIGDDVNINSRNVKTDLVSGPNGRVRIGNEVSINFGVSIVANKEVHIGDRVRIGPYTMIYDTDQHVHGRRYARAEGETVTVEDDCWLASRVLVLPGSRIGKGAVVASGSVVTGTVPPYVVVAGSPARVIRFLNPPENSGFMWERKMMSNDGPDPQIVSRIRKVASEALSLRAANLSPEAADQSLAEWDSFQYVKFINALENEFNVTFDPKELTRFSSLAKAGHIVGEYLNGDEYLHVN